MNTRRDRIRRAIFRVTVIVIGAYLGICLLLFLLQSRMLYFPRRALETTPQEVDLSYHDVEFEAADGVRLHGWFVPAEEPRGVLLFCHGNAGNISHRLASIAIFHRLGLSTFIFDYRGYGQSAGSPDEEGTYLDAEAAWRYLIDVKKVPSKDIIVFGRSLGAAVATHLADRHTPGALIVESAFTSVPDRAAELWPVLPVRAICRFEYNNEATLPRVHCPVLVVHSPDDTLIPIHHGRRLFEVAAEPKKFLEISGDHNSGFLTSGKVYTDGLDAFISKVAGEGKAPGRE